jgi:hypothetical protein
VIEHRVHDTGLLRQQASASRHHHIVERQGAAADDLILSSLAGDQHQIAGRQPPPGDRFAATGMVECARRRASIRFSTALNFFDDARSSLRRLSE